MQQHFFTEGRGKKPFVPLTDRDGIKETEKITKNLRTHQIKYNHN